MRKTDVGSITWEAARELLAAIPPLRPISVPLSSAVGAVLVNPILATTDLPVRDAATDHGWAVAGIGPWTIIAEEDLATRRGLPDGHAVAVAIGAPLPPGCTAVVPRDLGIADLAHRRARLQVTGPDGYPAASPGQIPYGSGIVPRAAQATAGTELLAGGAIVTPGTVALAAAAGNDDLTVIPPPSVAVVLPKYGLARRGPARPGRQRDVVADLLPTWVEAGPARLLPAYETTLTELAAMVDDISADIVIVSGGIEPGVPVEVRQAAEELAQQTLVAGLDLLPGSETAVYRLAGERFLITLPGRPAAAAAGLALVLEPLLDALAGHETLPPTEALVTAPMTARQTELVPCVIAATELALRAHPQRWHGVAGIQSLATADGLLVVSPGHHPAGTMLPVLPMPGVSLR